MKVKCSSKGTLSERIDLTCKSTPSDTTKSTSDRLAKDLKCRDSSSKSNP